MITAYGKFTRASFTCALLLSASVVVAGCQTKSAKLDEGDPIATGSTGAPSFTKTAELGERWKADPKNTELALAYADGLEKLGQSDQQIQVLEATSARNPQDINLKAIYGKKLLASGRSNDAIPVLEAVAQSGKADWRAHSALGSAYDQDSQHAKARVSYEKALALQPNEISVLNNMGMSYALEGNLKQAESTLRMAMDQPGSKAMPKIRQNLALVVGLQGRFDESREIASADLPPEEVDANLAYLQKMLSQPNTWQQLSSDTQG
jgi:Flp pilus assembly protein TadD